MILNSIRSQKQEQNNYWKGGKSTYKCLECGREFSAYASERARGGAKFCSTECGYENKRRRTMTTCENCGKEFEVRVYDLGRGQGKYCSRKCQGSAFRENYSGENSPLFGREKSEEHLENIRQNIPKGEDHYNWQGGFKIQDGYKRILTDDGYVAEHRIIAEKALGRPLKDGEVVHHISGDRLDNRNANLLICTNSYHSWLERTLEGLAEGDNHLVEGA